MNRSTRCSRSGGLTLIEVVAGLALLAGIVSSLLYAQVRFTRQARVLDARTRAVAAADDLLSEWWREAETFPINTAGTVPGGDGLRWRTTPRDDAALAQLRAMPVRLDIVDADGVIVSVDVVLPRARRMAR